MQKTGLNFFPPEDAGLILDIKPKVQHRPISKRGVLKVGIIIIIALQ